MSRGSDGWSSVGGLVREGDWRVDGSGFTGVAYGGFMKNSGVAGLMLAGGGAVPC